jgi:hypothetical protein
MLLLHGRWLLLGDAALATALVVHLLLQRRRPLRFADSCSQADSPSAPWHLSFYRPAWASTAKLSSPWVASGARAPSLPL